jgi:hypothetical protein
MDWQRAIDINREALARIVASLVALLAAQANTLKLPLPIYQIIARSLQPAESAVRRLIVIAARGLVVQHSPSRPMPKGLVIARKGSRVVFKLFDTRKHFSDHEETQSITGPRIRFVGEADPRSLFLAKFTKPADNIVSKAESLRLRNRLDAVKHALDTLPQQANRMARWLQRRATIEAPKFISPLRPGPPPGQRKQPRMEVDLILIECHGLAWDVLHHNTS